MRVLLLTQYFPPDITAAAFRLGAFRNALKLAGHEVVVITTYPYKGVTARKVDQEAGVFRIHLDRVGKGTTSRLMEQIAFSLQALATYLFALKPKKFDFVIASSPPLFVALVGILIAALARAVYIVDVRDIWPGSVVAAGFFSKKSTVIHIARLLELSVYRAADYIVCVSAGIAKHVIESSIHRKNEVRIVYNGVDQEAADWSEVEEKAIRSPEALTLMYAGNLGVVQQLDVLIEAVAKMKDGRRSELRVLLIGAGSERERLISRARELGVADHVSFMEPCERAVLVRYVAREAEALFLHLKRDNVLSRTIPSKVFEYLLYNLPIVFGLSGESAQLLESLGGSVPFEQGSSESLRAALEELLDCYDELRRTAAGHRRFVLEHYGREKTLTPLLNLVSAGR